MNICPECSSTLRTDGICSKCLLKLALDCRQSSSNGIDQNSLSQLNSHFPQLSILRMVGQGGMGAIYHARQTSLDRDVALKIIDRSISNDSTFLDRFEREAKALAKLSHPNIVSVFDYGKTSDGLAYFLMEFVHGLNLREAMQSMPIEISHTLEIIDSISESLSYAHSKGVVHRDIKPENILLSDDGRTKLADFGIAKINNAAFEKKITATRQVLGTIHYLAPEQLEASNEVDHRVDIYALGVVFYELITKQLPVGNFEPPSHLNPSVSRELDNVILKALSRKPSLRYQSVAEFKNAIQSIAKHLPQQNVSHKVDSHVDTPFPKNIAVSVPFQCEGMNGFSLVHGALQVNESGLKIEYRSQDAFLGSWKSKLRKLDLPWDRLVRIELKPGVFESKLQVYGDAFSLFEDFPGTEGGYLTVKVKKQNQDLAERMIERVRKYHPSLVSESNQGPHKANSSNLTVALLLVIAGFLNSGILAILQVAISHSGLAASVMAMLAVAVSVAMGPLILIQLVTGMIYGATGVSKVGQVGVIASMLPLSPLFVFAIPFASWAKQELTGNQSLKHNQPQTKYPRWGVTTMIFMRESRYATLVSTLESAGGLLVVTALAVWFLGAYPTTLHLRVVGNSPKVDILRFLDERLIDCSTANSVADNGQRVTIKCWRYQKNEILDRLVITEKPKLFICSTTGRPSQDSAPESSKVATDLFVSSFDGTLPENIVIRKSNLGRDIKVDKELLWDESWLNSVQKQSAANLTIRWSKLGATAFREELHSSGATVLALQVNGWIEAVSGEDDIKDNTISFQWLSGSKRSLASIQAALRGPSIDAEFELLD